MNSCDCLLTYCEACNDFVPYTVTEPKKESFVVKGVTVTASQRHAYCARCHAEVSPDEVIDYNVLHAHDEYRRELGSITSGEIKSLLEKYNIAAHPMSKLLGWGENTIERQIKHTIPDKEHARRLRELLHSPQKMKELLQASGDRIPAVAYSKAMSAVEALLSADAPKPLLYVSKSDRAPAVSMLCRVRSDGAETNAVRYSGDYSMSYQGKQPTISQLLAAVFH